MTGKRPPENHWLPVVTLLYSAAFWGVVWYPLRLLEVNGLAGAWSALVSYSAALLACAWVFVREFRAVAANPLHLMLMALAAGWCNVSFIMAVLDGTVVRVLLLFYLSPFWAVVLGWLMIPAGVAFLGLAAFFGLIDRAERTIDIQSFLLKDDVSGNLIALQFGAGRNWPLGAALLLTLVFHGLAAIASRRGGNRSRKGAAGEASAT